MSSVVGIRFPTGAGTGAGVPRAFAGAVLWMLVLAIAVAPAVAGAQEPVRGFADAVLGRWDLSIEGADGSYPSWLEIRLRTETQLMGRFVGRVGSVRHVTELAYADGTLRFVVPVQYEPRDSDLVFVGRLGDTGLEGSFEDAQRRELRWTGARAPALIADSAPEWGMEQTLFNGEYMLGWHFRDDRHAQCWSVDRGELVVTPPCVDLVSDEVFDDFRLHAEFVYPPGSNSGIYLRGRYEVQIQDDAGRALDPLRLGGIYGFIAPRVDAGLAAGQWQTLDVELVGRRVTVELNGTTIVDGQEIPGITGGALDSDEASAGPIMLQGDHGPIRFRNLTLRRAGSAADR